MASGTLEEQMKAKVEWTQLNDGEALTANKATRRAALQKNLRDNEPRATGDDDTEKSMRGWHLAKGLSVNGLKRESVIWHSSRPRQFTTKILPLQGMLGADRTARREKAARKKFKDGKNGAAAKDAKAARRKTDPKAYAEAKKEDLARKKAYAVAGGRIGECTREKTKHFTCGYIGKLLALMHIALYQDMIRPLICCCELWWLTQRTKIEVEFERWRGPASAARAPPPRFGRRRA